MPLRVAQALLICLSLLNAVSQAQVPMQERSLPDALADTTVMAGLARIDNLAGASAQALVEIGGIISPSGQEHERAAAVAAHMRQIGLQDVQISSAPNVGLLQ